MQALRNIAHGQVFDENFLMSIAAIGAMLIGEYAEGCAVMLFYQVGELFQSYSVGKSRRSITELMDIRPDFAVALIDGEEQKVKPETVEIGQTIVVRPGEKVPLDGVVISGSSHLDTSALSGESLPQEIDVGQTVLSGAVNLSGVLQIRVEKSFAQSTVSKILEMVENAAANKAKAENFITGFCPLLYAGRRGDRCFAGSSAAVIAEWRLVGLGV